MINARIKHLVIISSIAILLLAPSLRVAAEKRALLIGVWYDGRPKGYASLSSRTDVDAIASVLVNRLRFKATKVTKLTSKSNTTRDRILAALRQLVTETRQGDTIFIHYSGHGSKAPSITGAGIDETLGPSNYVLDFYHTKDISDKEVNYYLSLLKKKKPASVLVTFDCCHAGGMTRDPQLVVRGRGYNEKQATRTKNNPRSNAPHSREDVFTGWDSAVAFYACAKGADSESLDAQACEVQIGRSSRMGLFSYALTRVLCEATDSTTIRQTFEKISAYMRIAGAQYQRPRCSVEAMVEHSAVVAAKLLGGASPGRPALLVDKRGNQLVLQAGILQGVTARSRFALRRSGPSSADRLGVVEVVGVGPTESVVRLTESRGKLAFPTEAISLWKGYADAQLVVNLARARGAAVDNDLEQLVRVEHNPVSTDWDLRILGSRDEGFSVQRWDGTDLVQHVASASDLTRVLRNAAIRKLVESLQNDSPGSLVQVQMRVLPVICNDTERDAEDATFYRGDRFAVEIRNSGQMDAYVTVFDLSSDGTISLVWPPAETDIRPADNIVTADGEWHRLMELKPSDKTSIQHLLELSTYSPFETFKAIATADQSDFNGLLAGSTASRGHDLSPLELMVATMAQGKRGGSAAIESNRWYTCSFTVPVADSPRPSR